MAQWFMVALVRHPGFESRGFRIVSFLLSPPSRLGSNETSISTLDYWDFYNHSQV